MRQQIHEMIRRGHTVVFVTQGVERWNLIYRDGSHFVRSVILVDEAGVAA